MPGALAPEQAVLASPVVRVHLSRYMVVDHSPSANSPNLPSAGMQLQPERKGRNYNPSAKRWAPSGRYKAIGYKLERNRQIRPRKLAKPTVVLGLTRPLQSKRCALKIT